MNDRTRDASVKDLKVHPRSAVRRWQRIAPAYGGERYVRRATCRFATRPGVNDHAAAAGDLGRNPGARRPRTPAAVRGCGLRCSTPAEFRSSRVPAKTACYILTRQGRMAGSSTTSFSDQPKPSGLHHFPVETSQPASSERPPARRQAQSDRRAAPWRLRQPFRPYSRIWSSRFLEWRSADDLQHPLQRTAAAAPAGIATTGRVQSCQPHRNPQPCTDGSGPSRKAHRPHRAETGRAGVPRPGCAGRWACDGSQMQLRNLDPIAGTRPAAPPPARPNANDCGRLATSACPPLPRAPMSMPIAATPPPGRRARAPPYALAMSPCICARSAPTIPLTHSIATSATMIAPTSVWTSLKIPVSFIRTD